MPPQHSPTRASTILKQATTLAVPLATLAIITLFHRNPRLTDELAIEDALIENLSLIFLLLATLAMLIVSFQFIRRQQRLTAVVSLLASGLFFVIAMEEVSWFQRQLGLQSHDFFLQHNLQQEINLHNLNTNLSEQLYYFGGFFLLCLLPLFRPAAIKLLTIVRLSSLNPLLPPAWLAAPFAIIGALIHVHSFDYPLLALITIAGLLLLIGLSLQAVRRGQRWSALSYLLLISLYLITLATLLTADFQTLQVRSWVGSEYREFFIAWGLAAYASHLVAGARATSTSEGRARS